MTGAFAAGEGVGFFSAEKVLHLSLMMLHENFVAHCHSSIAALPNRRARKKSVA